MGVYHASGAMNIIDADSDGLTGVVNPNGYLRVLIDDVTYIGQRYDPTGATRVADQSLASTPIGVNGTDGSMNVNIVDGNTLVGLYAATGAINVVLQT